MIGAASTAKIRLIYWAYICSIPGGVQSITGLSFTNSYTDANWIPDSITCIYSVFSGSDNSV